MKSIICIALVMTLAFSSKVALTKSQHMKVLAQIDSHPLGEAILAQVSLTMSAQGPMKQVMEMVEGLQVELHETQAQCDSAHGQAVSTCNRLIPEYETKQKLHEDSRDTAKDTEEATRDLLIDAQDQLESAETELQSVIDRIAAGQKQRDTEHAAWTELDQEHADGISACQDAVNLLASMGRGALFIQLQGRIKSVTKRLEDMTHLNDKFTAYQPLIQSFSQIASSSTNPELLAQITKLISTLKQQITATRAADQGWEDRKQSAWDHELNDLTNQKNSLTQRRNALNDQIENFNHIIKENVDKFNFHSDEEEKFHYLHMQQDSWCDEETEAYNEETSYRNSEAEILEKLKVYLEQQVSHTEEFIMMKQTTD